MYEHNETMAQQYEPANPRKKRRLALISGGALAVIAVAITLAVVFSRRNKSHYSGTWVKTFPGPSAFDIVRPSAGIDQLRLSGQDGNRLFVSKRGSSFEPPFIEVLDCQTSSESDDQGKDDWEKSYELEARKDNYINFMVPSFDGKRLAVSDSGNVTVYQEVVAGSKKTWAQVGETLTAETLSGYINSSMVAAFGAHSMSLHETGKQLTVVARANWRIFTGEWSSSHNGHFIVASLKENNGKWNAVSVQKNINSVDLNNAKVVFAGSGDMMAIPRGDERNEDWKEKVDIFHRSTSGNESSSWELVDTLVNPEAAAPTAPPMTLVNPENPSQYAPPMTRFGMNDHSIAVSYDGTVCVVGAANYQVGHRQYGRIDVYRYSQMEGSYTRMGQGLESSPAGYSLGLIVSVNNDGSRLAAYFTQDGYPRIRVYQYNEERNRWYSLGNDIVDLDPYRGVEFLEFSSSKLVVAVGCQSRGIRAPCFVVYDLVE